MMIGYICLLYIGIQIGASWWYYLLLAIEMLFKFAVAIIEAAKG